MKMLGLVLFCSLIKMPLSSSNTDLELIRNNFSKAPSNKAVCRTMIDELKLDTHNPVKQAYLGGFQTIWAKHTINPISKLSTFNRGKKSIEAAVGKAPNDVEIRFIRLSVQQNCPSFLGYNDQIENDKKFIQTHGANISSPSLRKMMTNIITKSKP